MAGEERTKVQEKSSLENLIEQGFNLAMAFRSEAELARSKIGESSEKGYTISNNDKAILLEKIADQIQEDMAFLKSRLESPHLDD